MRKRIISEEVYQTSFTFLQEKDVKKAAKAIRAIMQEIDPTFEIEVPPNNCNGRTYLFNGRPYLIWIREMSPSVIAHELSHAAIATLDRNSIAINQSNDEPFCYLLECYVRQAFL